MRTVRIFTSVVATGALAACGAAGGGETEAIPAVWEAPQAEPAIGDATPRAVPAPEAAVTPEVRPAAERQELEQPAIWPAADVVFATPEEAAADFVREVLISDGEPELGEFQQGDARSGEIVVFFPGEGAGATPTERGLLALRQLGPDDGWFVIAASSDGVTITSPVALARVAAGPLTVEGVGRGFEATLVVSAFPPGGADAEIDSELASGGAFETAEPYSAVLDLSGAEPDDVVVVLVQGDTGLGSDPGEFAAIPVAVDGAAPGTIPPTR